MTGIAVRGESGESKGALPVAKQPPAPPTSTSSEIKLPDSKRKKLA